MTAPGGTPARDKLRLRLALRNARMAKNLTQRDVAEAMDWSTSKLVRIEGGDVGIATTDLKALLQEYGITDADRIDQLVELARRSRQPAWYRKYREHYSEDFFTFLELEASSVRVRQFQQLLVPGLLQAPEYIKVLMRLATTPERAEWGMEIRTKRQELIADDSSEMFFILDESVLHRQIGDNAVMGAQLRHLKELAAMPNISVQILPFSAGVHAGMQESFEIFELSDEPNNYALQLDGILKDKLFARPTDETAEYLHIFQKLEKIALPASQTPRIIDERLSQMNA